MYNLQFQLVSCVTDHMSQCDTVILKEEANKTYNYQWISEK